MSRRSNWYGGSSTLKSGMRCANTIRLPIGWRTRLWIEEDEARFQFKVLRASHDIQRDLETLKSCNLEFSPSLHPARRITIAPSSPPLGGRHDDRSSLICWNQLLGGAGIRHRDHGNRISLVFPHAFRESLDAPDGNRSQRQSQTRRDA